MTLLEIKKRFEKEKPLKGIKVGMALHVTKETAVLIRTLIAGGAQVARAVVDDRNAPGRHGQRPNIIDPIDANSRRSASVISAPPTIAVSS